jgi:pilin isopeptide linkage protein
MAVALLLLISLIPSSAFADDQEEVIAKGNPGEQSVTLALEGELQVEGNKTRDTTRFHFVLKRENTAEPEEYEESVDGAGTFTFDEITFTKPGHYYYTVDQVEGDATGYTYDTAIYDIIVTVYWEGNTLYATYEGSKDGGTEKVTDVLFINTYSDEPEEEEPETSPGVSPGPGVSPNPGVSPTPGVSPSPSPSQNPEVSPEPSQDVEPNPEVSPEPSQDVEPNPEESPKPSEEVEPSPSQSTNPTETVTPTTSTKPTTTTTTTTTSTGSTPKTGDETNNTVWYLLLGIVAIGLIGCIGYLRASRKHSR